MPGALDSCINNVYADGNIPASSGLTPVRVLLKDALEAAISETAAALDTTDIGGDFNVAMVETAAAVDAPDVAGPALVPRDAMLPGVFVNSDGTLRQANVNGVMVNL